MAKDHVHLLNSSGARRRYEDAVVHQPGDTLWDISAKFLTDPWYWPEIWHVNPQVANPHLIYPGDELALTWVDGRPRVSVASGGPTRLSPRVRENRWPRSSLDCRRVCAGSAVRS